MEIIINIAILILGFFFLVKGSDYFVDGAAKLASRIGIPELIIGLTIVAMGTSAPEAAVSITAAFKGSAEITIGNIIGSNIFNILVILGIACIMVPIAVEKTTVKYEIPYMVICTVLLILLGIDGEINIIDGIILWAGFILYLAYLFLNATKNKKECSSQSVSDLWKQIIFIIGGIIAIVAGSKFAVYGATELARFLGISERVIGLTIVAVGTSLPELFTSVTAARKGNADIAIGNIVGSNIFNILFVIGTTALIVNVPFDAKFIIDGVIAVAAAIVLFLGVIRKRKLCRGSGIIMLICYAVYLLYLFLK